MSVNYEYARGKLQEWHPEWDVSKFSHPQTLAVYHKEAAKVAKKLMEKSQAGPKFYQPKLFEEVNEMVDISSRELLKAEVLRLAEDIFRRKWPRGKTTREYTGGTLIQDRTSTQEFLRATFKLPKGTLTLIQSNPAKVTDAGNKVMMYWETPHSRMVGQVRRTPKGMEVVWFK